MTPDGQRPFLVLKTPATTTTTTKGRSHHSALRLPPLSPRTSPELIGAQRSAPFSAERGGGGEGSPR